MKKVGSTCYPARLHERHKQAARLLLSGASNERIALELHLPRSTVKIYVHRLLDWYGADNRTHLAMKILHDAKLLAEVME